MANNPISRTQIIEALRTEAEICKKQGDFASSSLFFETIDRLRTLDGKDPSAPKSMAAMGDGSESSSAPSVSDVGPGLTISAFRNKSPLPEEEYEHIRSRWEGYEYKRDGEHVTLTRENSRVVYTPGQITFYGEAEKDPSALIRAALHAFEYWDKKAWVYGPENFRFRATIALELCEVEVTNYKIAQDREGEAEQVRVQMQEALEAELLRSPAPLREKLAHKLRGPDRTGAAARLQGFAASRSHGVPSREPGGRGR